MKKLFQMFTGGGMASAVNISINSCSSGEKVFGSGRITEKNISLEHVLEEIVTDGVFNVKVEYNENTQGKVLVSGDDNIIDYVVVKEESGTLKLDIKENTSFVTNNEITVTVYTDVTMIKKIEHKGTGNLKMIGSYNLLNSVKQTGVGNVKIETVTSNDCSITQDGVGSISFVNITCNTCIVKKTGVGKLRLQGGSIAKLNIKSDGVGSTDMTNVVVTDAIVKNSGVGNIVIAPKKQLDVTISGVGNVTCIGKPVSVSKKESGLGRLKYK